MRFDIHKLLIVTLVLLLCSVLFVGGLVVQQYREASVSDDDATIDTSARVSIDIVAPDEPAAVEDDGGDTS